MPEWGGRCSVHLQDNFDLEVDFLGRRGLDRENSFTLEMSGRHLAYHIQHDNGFVFVMLREMDSVGEWKCVLSVADTPKSWETIYKLIADLETHEVKSLEKPIQIGNSFDGPDCTVIS